MAQSACCISVVLSIHLVTVIFTTTSSETKLQPCQKEHATVLQRKCQLISSVHIVMASSKEMEKYLRRLDLPNRHIVVVAVRASSAAHDGISYCSYLYRLGIPLPLSQLILNNTEIH